MFELIGWIGGFLLAICAVPQAIKVYQDKSGEGLSWLMLWFWFKGEIFTLYYIVVTNLNAGEFQWPLLFNYILNIFIITYIIIAKYIYGKKKKSP